MDIAIGIVIIVLERIWRILLWIIKHSLLSFLIVSPADKWTRKNGVIEFFGGSLCAFLAFIAISIALECAGLYTEEPQNENLAWLVFWIIVLAPGVINAVLASRHNSRIDAKESTCREAEQKIIAEQNRVKAKEQVIEESRQRETELCVNLQNLQKEYSYACSFGSFFRAIGATFMTSYEHSILSSINGEENKINALIEQEQNLQATQTHAIENCKREIDTQNEIITNYC